MRNEELSREANLSEPPAADDGKREKVMVYTASPR